MPKFKNLSGQIFHDLEVLEFSRMNRSAMFFCYCHACQNPNLLEIMGTAITSGKTQSCGCLAKTIAQNNGVEKGMERVKRLIGNKYGRLTVKNFSHFVQRKSGKEYFVNCDCECGNKKVVSTRKLENGRVRSCRCLQIETSKSRCGPKSHMWKHSISMEERWERVNGPHRNALPEYLEWKEKVFERDRRTCQLTGRMGKITPHHLEGYNWCVDNRYNLDNGITILIQIHKLFHRLYGQGNNTAAQFEEFTIRYHSGEFNTDYQI